LTIRVSVFGEKELSKKLSNLITDLGPQTQKAIKNRAKAIQRDAKKEVKVWRGMLRDRIIVKNTKRGVLITAKMPYAGAQEFGFRPHKVSTRGHPKLRKWMAEKGLIDFGSITLGGRGKGSSWKPFLRPAVTKNIPTLSNDIVKRIENILK